MQASKTLRVLTRQTVIKALVNKNVAVPMRQAQYKQMNMGMGMTIPRMSFSSLPDHMKMEMPNLSPTMEKVSMIHSITHFSAYRETSAYGTRRLVTRLSQVMFSAVLRLTRPLLTSRCRMKGILLRFFTQRVPRTFLSVKLLLLLLMILMILLPSKITNQLLQPHQLLPLLLPQSLLNLLPHQLSLKLQLLLPLLLPQLRHQVTESLLVLLLKTLLTLPELILLPSAELVLLAEFSKLTSMMLSLPVVPLSNLRQSKLLLSSTLFQVLPTQTSPTLKSERSLPIVLPSQSRTFPTTT